MLGYYTLETQVSSLKTLPGPIKKSAKNSSNPTILATLRLDLHRRKPLTSRFLTLAITIAYLFVFFSFHSDLLCEDQMLEDLLPPNISAQTGSKF